MNTASPLAEMLRLKEVLVGVALGIVLITAIAAFAHADAKYERGPSMAVDRSWQWHERLTRGYWNRSRYVPEPGVIYAPPLVDAPPLEDEEPGSNFIFPLNIR